jgi:hypothetical protein
MTMVTSLLQNFCDPAPYTPVKIHEYAKCQRVLMAILCSTIQDMTVVSFLEISHGIFTIASPNSSLQGIMVIVASP